MNYTGGGRFDRSVGPVYFLAQQARRMLMLTGEHKWHLLESMHYPQPNSPVWNRIQTELSNGLQLLVDSGVFMLLQQWRSTRGMTWSQALAVPPPNISGFDKLRAKYIEIVRLQEDKLWGYIEIDLGGSDWKRRIRRELESEGLRPIPVYHPLVDPPEYFDELCSGYDRVCVGNLAKTADDGTYLPLMEWVFKRRSQYPHVWIHLLGHAVLPTLFAWEANSIDASSWMTDVIYGHGIRERAAGAPMRKLGRPWVYNRSTEADSETGEDKAMKVAAHVAHYQHENWRTISKRFREVGLHRGEGTDAFPLS